MRFWRVWFALMVFAGLLAGCGQDEEDGPGLPNPASVHCEEQGGTVDIRTGDDGGQVGYCVFDDGSECEEWAYFREECAPGDH